MQIGAVEDCLHSSIFREKKKSILSIARGLISESNNFHDASASCSANDFAITYKHMASQVLGLPRESGSSYKRGHNQDQSELIIQDIIVAEIQIKNIFANRQLIVI